MITNSKKRKAVIYTTYKFRDRDPILAKTQALIDSIGLTSKEIHEATGVSRSTLGNWKPKGKTMRPQFCTVEAVARACGKTLVFVDSRKAPG